MRVFDDVLDTLSDGEYHKFGQIRFATARNLNGTQLELVLVTLSTAGFIKRLRIPRSIRTWKAKLEPQTLDFLKRIKELEGVDVKQEAPQQ